MSALKAPSAGSCINMIPIWAVCKVIVKKEVRDAGWSVERASPRVHFGGELHVQQGGVASSWNDIAHISLSAQIQTCINLGNNINAIWKPILITFLTHFRLLLVIWEGTFVPMAAHNFLSETVRLSSEWQSQAFGCLSCFQVFRGSSFLTYCTMPQSHWEGENWIRKKI